MPVLFFFFIVSMMDLMTTDDGRKPPTTKDNATTKIETAKEEDLKHERQPLHDFMNNDYSKNDNTKDFNKHEKCKKNFNKNFKKNFNLKKGDNKSIESYTMNFYLTNIRGLRSKLESFKNILIEGKIDIAMVTESHCQRDSCIKIPNYTVYYRNRCQKEKGGVCIYVNNKFANSCVKLETGLDASEYFVLKLECFTPSLILIVFYGVIEQQFPNEVIAMQGDLFEVVKKYVDEGNSVFWAWDFNNHLGEELGLKGNTGKMSEGGENLVNFVKEEELELLNQRDVTHTHVDKKHGTTRILDLVLTNVGSKVTNFKVDGELKNTPYRLIKCKGGQRRVFTDHVGVKWSAQLQRNTKKTNKTTMWNMDKKGGNAEYERITNSMAVFVENKVMECDDIEEIYDYILEMIDKAKDEAYGKTTKTKSQMRRQSDKQIWRQRTKEVERAVESMEKVRLTDRVWEMRGKLSEKFDDRQFVGVRDPKSGKITQDREETFDVLINYNEELMKKDESEEEEDEELIALQEAKKFILEEALKADTFAEDETLTVEDFERVIKKIKQNNKNVYSDFIKAGHSFQLAIFLFYKKCYEQETRPQSFSWTELLKLFKGKGNRLELRFNRFIHLKPWGPKVYEKMLMTKFEDKLFGHTPEFQVGGQRMGSTNEHLLAMITVMRRLERENQGGGIVFMDIKACFDKIRLQDILFESTQCGVMGRPLRAIKDYTDNLVIHMQGDPDMTRTATLTNTTGQGSGFAPVGTSMVMAKTLENNMKSKSPSEQDLLIGKVKNLELKPNFFVDDLAKPCQNNSELKANGDVITETLDELKLQAHPEKSGILVFGENQEQLVKEIKNDPPKVQKFNLNIKSEETYLGMCFTNQGADDSIIGSQLS